MNPIRTACLIGAALALAACSEAPQVTHYEAGSYSGKPGKMYQASSG